MVLKEAERLVTLQFYLLPHEHLSMERLMDASIPAVA
jgi:hypothetical protein